MYYYTSSSLMPHHHIKVTPDIREDLKMWLQFLHEPTVYCRPFLDFSQIITADKVDWYTDALGQIGHGGICGNRYFQGRWSPGFIDNFKPSIEYLELYAVAVSVLLWAKLFANKRICIFVDNESVEKMICNSSTNCKNCLVLIRKIVLECMTWNVRLCLTRGISKK